MNLKLKKGITVLLIILTVAISSGIPVGVNPHRHIAHAQETGILEGAAASAAAGVAACAAAWGINQLISQLGGSFSLLVPTADPSNDMKQLFLDCLVYHLNNVVIVQITDSIVSWIQTGFDGNPAWPRSLSQTYQDAVNSAAGDFIGGELSLLCSTIRPQVQLGALNDHLRSDTFSCTLGDVVENIEDFANGNFDAGGWRGWFELTQNPQNNIFGATALAQRELALTKNLSLQVTRDKLTFSAGFLGREKCEFIPDPSFEGPPAPLPPDPPADFVGPPPPPPAGYIQDCQTTTPGSVVEDQLNRSISAPSRRIEVSKGINEIMSALFAFLVSDILRGSGGLAEYRDSDFSHELPDIEIPDLPPIGDGGGGRTTPHDSEPAGPPGPSTCFVQNGVFHEPTPGNEVKGLTLPLPQNVSYDEINLTMDFEFDSWNPEQTNAFHMIFWLARKSHTNLFGYFLARGPNKNLLVLRHGIGQRHLSKPRTTRNEELQPNTKYNVEYVYDVSEEEIELVVRRGNTVVKRLTSTPDVPGINTGDERFIMEFGFKDGQSPVEFPTYGWEYSNLRVSFLSDGDTPANCTAPGDRPVGNSANPGGGGPEANRFDPDQAR